MMYGLWLNCMHCNAEQRELVAVARSVEALVAFQESEAVEPYDDGPWHKTFRRGGPLENFNPLFSPHTMAKDEPMGHGIDQIATREEVLARTAEQYDAVLSRAVDADAALAALQGGADHA